MRVALVAQGSPFLRNSWSGIPFYAHRELARRFPDLHVLDTPRLDDWLRHGSGLARVGFFPAREPWITDHFRRLMNRRLAAVQPDIVVSIGAPHKVVDIHRKWPVIHVTDAMFASVIEHYPKYQLLNARSRQIGNALQARLITRASKILLCSEWAAMSAAAHYGVPAETFRVAPMGANLDEDPGSTEQRPATGPLRLLFVGYDWARKGGDIALAILRELRRRGYPAELHIVGCKPPEADGADGVVSHGVLLKSDPIQGARLRKLFRTSSFFLMPSRQEAYGLVYCEACAFGLPPVGARTGGVGAIIEDSRNGLLLPLHATPQEYADRMLAVWSDGGLYRSMQSAARADYLSRLNWRTWGDIAELEIRAGANSSPPLPGSMALRTGAL
jgi:glycosyltransferase involved in cell wall biosynthesis